MINLNHLSVRLDEKQILGDVTLQISEGSWLCLIGPNGAGKTTLLRALLGILPYSGSATIKGVERRGDHDYNIAFVPQRAGAPAGMTILEYVSMGRAKKDGWGRETSRGRDAVMDALAKMELVGMRDQFVTRISGGEMQRVLIARAISQQADVILLDEPTSALDLHHQVSALDQIEELRRGGATIVSTMHDITLAAMYANRFALLNNGRLIDEGAPTEIVHSPRFAEMYGRQVRVFTGEDGLPVILPTRNQE